MSIGTFVPFSARRIVISFRPFTPADMPMLHDWLSRPHVAERWQTPPPSLSDVEADFLPLTQAESTTRRYIALLDGQPLGFIQSYVVKDSGDGWWDQETDPGARGIDQFLANVEQLGRGLGSEMVRAFVDTLFIDPSVTKVQTDPAPDNVRAVRSYMRAGFTLFAEVRALLMVRYREGRMNNGKQSGPSFENDVRQARRK